jgi:hypothetical protein
MKSKREKQRLTHQEDTLVALGFTYYEADKLRLISNTLRRWYERECGDGFGCIERDETTDKPYWLSAMTGRRSLIADREKGAIKRLAHIIGLRNTRAMVKSGATSVKDVAVNSYLQTDPRGAALYLMRPNDLADGADVESCYTRGLCVY